MASLQADALRLPIADNSVDLIVTSPPYFGLRCYANGGIGEEPTPAEYVDALIAATREMIRVLKPSGSIFVSLGDKYCGYTNGQGKGRNVGGGTRGVATVPDGPVSAPTVYGVPNKSLMGLPWRYAIRCVDELGLILRRDIVWSKPNGMPESVTDRCRSSHEYWFHMTTQPRYYAAIDEIREPHIYALPQRRNGLGGRPNDAAGRPAADGSQHLDGNPLGKPPGSVWTIPTEPLRLPDELGVEHYAAFPSEWPRRLILGWSPREICTACGEGRAPVGATVLDESKPPARRNTFLPNVTKAGQGSNGAGSALWGQWTKRLITGYACACPDNDAPSTPSIVLDPFGGTGTTAAVAQTLGRTGISVDLAYDYACAAVWRANDPGLRAKILGVDKPAPVLAGQQGLFE